MSTFSDVVDAAGDLSVGEQETLLEILRHRIAMQNRKSLVSDVADARAEYQYVQACTKPASDIMDEVRGES